MKNFLISFAALFFLTPALFAEDNSAHRYDVKSGIIEYTVSGARVGIETLYFDDWGKTEARVSKTSTNLTDTPNSPDDSLSLIKDGKSYVIDLRSNKGTVTDNSKTLAMSGDTSTRTQMSLPTSNKITIAGEECIIWKSALLNSESCLWKNLPLKTTSGSDSMLVTKSATKITITDQLPADAFKLPENLDITTLNLSELFEIPATG
ncbi:MAG: hypothetical protein R3A13_00555 [Bdellovibrionota bacterium]